MAATLGAAMGTTGANNGPPALSVVVPVYNGAAFITSTLSQLCVHLVGCGRPVELIVVDDGSTDQTPALLQRFAQSAPVRMHLLRSERNEGKGAAIGRGMRAALGEFRVFLDADLAYPPAEIETISSALENGADLAIANRVDRRSRLMLNPAFFLYYALRHFGGRILNGLVRGLLLPRIADSQAGLKGFRAAAADRLFSGWLPRGFSFDIALLFRARRLGLRIESVPVQYRYENEPTTVRWASDSGRMVRDVFQIRVRFVGDRFEQWHTLGSAVRARTRTRLGTLLGGEPALVMMLVSLGVALMLLAVGRFVAKSSLVAATAWIVAIGSVLALAWRADLRQRARPLRGLNGQSERFGFVLVLVLCAALRFVRLGDFPAMIHIDDAACGLLGLDILRGRVADIFGFSDWYFTPYLSFLPYAASFAVSGVTVSALRIPSAVMGTLTIVPLYFLVRGWFGVRPALLTAALYAISHPAIHFSRTGLWNIQVLFYETTAFALLFGALRSGRRVWAALAGIPTGLALYSYTGGRLIPALAILFLGIEIVRRRRRVWRTLGWFLAGLVVTVAPLALSYAQDPGVFGSDRAAAMWVLSPVVRSHVEATLGTTDPAGILWEQVKRTMQGFVSRGDASTQYGTEQPLISPFVAVAALFGVGTIVWTWRRRSSTFLLLWSVLGLLLASILVLDSPSYTRLVVFFPVPFILAAVGLETLTRATRERVWLRAPIAALYLLVLANATVFNLGGYYRFMQGMGEMPREWDVLQVIAQLGDGYDYYIYTGPYLLSDSPILRLFAANTRTISGFSERDLPKRLTRDAAFVLTPDFRRLGIAIADRFPGAERETIDQDGIRQIIVYRCTDKNGCRDLG